MFNDKSFIKEHKDIIKSLVVKSVMEIGCQSGELLFDLLDGLEVQGVDLEPKLEKVLQGDIRDFKSKKKYDVVFSSGMLGHFPIEEIPEIVKKMANLSKNYILNYVPNANCVAYMNCKSSTTAEWKDELAFTVDDFLALHEVPGIEIVQSGVIANEWAKLFGQEPSEGYLVYVLAKKVK